MLIAAVLAALQVPAGPLAGPPGAPPPPPFATMPTTDPAKWDWPPAASDPAVRDSIVDASYSAEELRNIWVELQLLSGPARRQASIAAGRPMAPPAGFGGGPQGPNSPFAPDAKMGGRGFRQLEPFYGANGYANDSIPDRVNVIDYIIAKGDRVFVSWRIRGHHNGKLFGFAPTGKPVDIRETARLRFRDGKIIESDFLGDEFALYVQAGGKIALPETAPKP